MHHAQLSKILVCHGLSAGDYLAKILTVVHSCTRVGAFELLIRPQFEGDKIWQVEKPITNSRPSTTVYARGRSIARRLASASACAAAWLLTPPMSTSRIASSTDSCVSSSSDLCKYNV